MPRNDTLMPPPRRRRWLAPGRCRAGLAAAGVLLAVATLAAESIRVTPLARDDRLLVSFAMKDGFTDAVREAISSGLTTMFIYDVELRRSAAVWFDRTIAAATISASVRFDNLTRRYQVTRMLDGRVEDSRMVDDADVVEKLMTEFEKLALFSTGTLEPSAEYYVRVRARMRPRNALVFLPWDRASASGIGKFTFIP
jgi:hypothetical protein